MTTWFRISFEHAVTHAVPKELFDPLLTDLLARGALIKDFSKSYSPEYAKQLGDNPTQITDWAFDVGGYYCVGMPIETVEVDGLKIDVPCDMLGMVITKLERTEPRRFADHTPYFKLKFYVHATVLTPEQLLIAKRELSAREDAAHRKAEAYYRDHPLFGESERPVIKARGKSRG